MRILLGILIWSLPAPAADQLTARVTRVVDGDTLVVETSVGLIKVRLFGVDSPEKHQDGAEAATSFTTNMALHHTVQLEEYYTDRYGRMVADVVLPDGRMLNRELVGAGQAWWCPRYAPGDADLEELEKGARARHVGLWAAANPLPPWEWRKTAASRSRAASRQSRRSGRRYGRGSGRQYRG